MRESVGFDAGDPADLELRLTSDGYERHLVALTLRMPGDAADSVLLKHPAPFVQIDRAALLERTTNPLAYGEALTRMVFPTTATILAFTAARQRAFGARVPLRIRLAIAPGKLDDLWWETLQDPTTYESLAIAGNVMFTRFVASPTPLATRKIDSGALRALVAIAAPDDLNRYGLAPLSMDEELRFAHNALESFTAATLPRATLAGLADALRDEPTLLYLICHGKLVDGNPVIYLSDDDGLTRPVPGEQLVTMLQTLVHSPKLVVLASCQSAGRSHGGLARIALGPQMAEAGIGAIIAMQDAVTLNALRRGLPALFSELARHGRIDLAMTAMRHLLAADGHPWWQPVLFMRLRDGRLFAPSLPAIKAAPIVNDELQRLRMQKLQHLRRARIIETDAAVQFKLDLEIAEIEQQLDGHQG